MHVHDQHLEMYLLDRLEGNETSQVESHLDRCAECATRLSSVAFFDQLVELSRRQAVVNGTEKRRDPRVSTEDPGILQRINPFSPERSSVLILDVSKNGMKVGAPVVLFPGTMVKVRMKTMVAFGDVRHCREIGDFYQAGIRLYDTLLI